MFKIGVALWCFLMGHFCQIPDLIVMRFMISVAKIAHAAHLMSPTSSVFTVVAQAPSTYNYNLFGIFSVISSLKTRQMILLVARKLLEMLSFKVLVVEFGNKDRDSMSSA